MAFSGNFMCSSFKQELLEAKHNFLLSGGHDMTIALYTSTAAFTAATTAYTATNEISGTAYSAPGAVLTRIDPTIGTPSTTAYTDFADEVWGTASFTAAGAMIYNATTAGDPSVVILDFGGDKTATAGDFTVQFPTDDGTNAIIRIA
jgi:hypothetical protein